MQTYRLIGSRALGTEVERIQIASFSVAALLMVAAMQSPADERGSGTRRDLKYGGKVTEAGSGKPIAGATVVVRRIRIDPDRTKDQQTVEETKHVTDSEGKYEFTVTANHAAEPLYIALDVTHRDYPPITDFGYSLAMIRKNEELGARPFFENISLRPGKPITGRVETVGGKPAPGISVWAYSTVPDPLEYGSFARGQTDADGRFRLVLITPGDVVLWVIPEKHAPITHVIENDRRGDLGIFALDPGIVLNGKALDADGKPLAGIFVNAEPVRGPGQPNIVYQVASAACRTAVTNPNGEWEMPPLAPEAYKIEPSEQSADYLRNVQTRRPLPAVFHAEFVNLRANGVKNGLTLRAIPHVTIQAQYLNSKEEPQPGHEIEIVGRIKGRGWYSAGSPDAKGKIVALVPRGMEETRISLSTNEHSSLRHRLAKDMPLSATREIDLGTIGGDVKGIQIFRYKAPTVLIEVAGKDGGMLKDVVVYGLYKQRTDKRIARVTLPSGVESDIFFEKQRDGRYRTSGLLPDDEMTITAKAEGHQPASVKVKLPEGVLKTVSLRLEK